MAFEKVAKVGDVAPNGVIEILRGYVPYALCRIGDEWHALAGTCPHRGGPLGQGAVEGRNVLCPWHLWAFDCVTGQNDFYENCSVKTFAVRVEGDDVLADLA